MQHTAEGNSIVATRDFIKIVIALMHKGYSIETLDPKILAATFRTNKGVIGLRIDETSIPVFVLGGAGINPEHKNGKTGTLAITGDDNVLNQSLSVLVQTKPPIGTDILTAFVFVVLTEVAPMHVMLSQAQKLSPISGIEVVKDKQGTKVTLKSSTLGTRTLTFKDPTSFNGSDILYNTVQFCDSPYRVLDLVLSN